MTSTTAPKGLTAAALKLFSTDEYSDLEIRCGTYSAKVHKAVVCIQSPYFASAVREGRWLEGHTGMIALSREDPAVVKAMVSYLYTGDYDDSGNPVSEASDSEDAASPDECDLITQATFHIHVYAVADFVQVDDLKSTTECKIASCLSNIAALASPLFAELLRNAYSTAPTGEHGNRLRDLFVSRVVRDAKVALQNNDTMRDLMQDVPVFSADLALALAGCHPTITKHYEDWYGWSCDECKGLFATTTKPGKGLFAFGIGLHNYSSSPQKCPNGCTVAGRPATRSNLVSKAGFANHRTFMCGAGHKFRASPGPLWYKCPTCEHSALMVDE